MAYPRVVVRASRLYSRRVKLDIDTLASDGRRWAERTTTMPWTDEESRIIDSGGVLRGVFSQPSTGIGAFEDPLAKGTWLSTSDGGRTWQKHETPMRGVMSYAHGLWLVGPKRAHTVLFESGSDGRSWRQMSLPVTLKGPTREHEGREPSEYPGIFQRPELSAVLPDGEGVVTTASNQTETQVLLATPSASGWQWAHGATLKLVPYGTAPSEAAGVLWILGSGRSSGPRSGETRIARVTLATGKVSTVTAHALPANGALSLNASGAEAAWASYDMAYSCKREKGDCIESRGVIVTNDGGASWHALFPPEHTPVN